MSVLLNHIFDFLTISSTWKIHG